MGIGTQKSDRGLEVVTQRRKRIFEEVEEFVYSRVLLTNKFEEVKEVDINLQKASRSSGSVNHLKTTYLARSPNQTLVVNKKLQEKLLRSERKMIRRINSEWIVKSRTLQWLAHLEKKIEEL